MSALIEFTKDDAFGVIMLTVCFINCTLLVYNIIKTTIISKKYNEFMKKLSNGANIEEMLRKYIQDVLNVSEENEKIKKYCKELNKNMEKCIQKVGMVRYTAFQNTGSDLCFALALLDFEDNGFVINGIYSRDNTTTTYAKPIERGKSKYTLVKEEEEALDIAKHSGYKYFIDINN